MDLGDSRGISRRDFVASAVAIGGSAALSACQGRELPLSSEESDGPEFPRGTDPASLPDGQHRWNSHLVHDVHGNTKLPQHQLVLGLTYVGTVPPTEEEREQVAAAMDTLDRAFQWGTGDGAGATINNGLLTMLGYSPAYFDKLDAAAPEGLTPPSEVLEAVGEDPAKADDFDALLILNSDYGSITMAAEQALFGEREAVNGLEMAGTFEGVFEKATRRTGIVGKGHVAEEMDNEDVPEEAPLSMGFRSGLADNQPPEDRITIESGPFAGGTLLQASRLHIDTDRWYEHGQEERAAEMFCPAHDTEELGETAESLGSGSEITKADADSVEEHAEEYGRVGHTQKVARARDDSFRPRILRRTEGVATGLEESGVGFNFHSIQRSMDAFVDARKAMNVDEYDTDIPADDHGIVDYLETRARGTFVVPTRDDRALPEP